MKEKKGFLLQTVRQMNGGAALCGVGFLLYLGASALGWVTAADILTIAFGVVSLYVFISVSEGRRKDKEAVSPGPAAVRLRGADHPPAAGAAIGRCREQAAGQAGNHERKGNVA